MASMRRSGIVLGLAALAVAARGWRGLAQTASTAEVRGLFERFVAAQNVHDPAAVEALLWDSLDFLWITRGAALWGR